MPGSAVDTLQVLGLTAVVASQRMRQLLELTQRVARTSATVLITGESGSGKELIARALHHYSLRCHRPWVDISCGALPEQLMESELFGFEKGAFSGAGSAKPGLFELAHTGTLFLDEIGELEPRMQAKLLRVLDGAPYYKLGGTRKVSVDVRILCASNRNLPEQSRNGGFREDLYHRLSQVRLHVPPLRERPDDIVPLARYFLQTQNPALNLGAAAERRLEQYCWPGNVRELRNLIIRAAILAPEGLLEPEHLGLPELAALAGNINDPTLDGLERQTILRVLDEMGGRRQRTADRLGISRRTLTRKLRLYGLPSGEALEAAPVNGAY
jgi:DNA-binding NtrC family response regulator